MFLEDPAQVSAAAGRARTAVRAPAHNVRRDNGAAYCDARPRPFIKYRSVLRAEPVFTSPIECLLLAVLRPRIALATLALALAVMNVRRPRDERRRK